MEKKQFDKSEMKKHFGISDTRVDDVLAELSSIGALAIREDGTYEAVMDKEQFQERIRHYQKMADRMEKEAMLKSGNVIRVALDKSIIAEEDENRIKIPIDDKESRFIYFNKNNLSDNEKSYGVYLKKDAVYPVCDKNGKSIEMISFNNLISAMQNMLIAKAVKEEEKKQQKKQHSKEKSSGKIAR